MTDFYQQKKSVIAQVENAIKQITKQGQSVDQELLMFDVSRVSGFSRSIAQHIDGLVNTGRVRRDTNDKGKQCLTWVEGKE